MSRPDSLDAHWQSRLDALASDDLLRTAQLPQGRDFSSNDTLGLSRDPAVIAAAQRACQRDGVGARAARLLRGELAVHQQAEQALAEWQGSEAALLCPSGFQANLALLGSVAEKGDLVYSDRLNHASLIDGARASLADARVYPHQDVAALRTRLQRDRDSAGRRWVVTERIFSMDGDAAPLQELLDLCEAEDAWLIVDEAHAAGVLPPLPAHPRLVARILTGGKALGVAGGAILGSRALIEWIRNRGRGFVYTTATPPPVAAALTAAVRQIRARPELGERCLARAEQLRCKLREQGWPVTGDAAITSIVLGDAARTMQAATSLQAEGWDVRAIRPPTVPEGTSRLRVVCHADHSELEIEALSESLTQVLAAGPSAPAIAVREQARPLPSACVVAGTDTGVGKTVASALLALELERRGAQVRYLKPIQTGDDDDTHTVRQLAQLDAQHSPGPLLHFPLPASPDQAAEEVGARLDLAPVIAAVRETLRSATAPEASWLIEGAGGLRVPWNEHEDQLDFFARLNLPVVLVARSGLGTLNHSLLSLDALRARGLRLAGLLLVGPHHAANHASLAPRLAQMGRQGTPLPCVSVPHFADLRPSRLHAFVASGALSELALPTPHASPQLSHA